MIRNIQMSDYERLYDYMSSKPIFNNITYNEASAIRTLARCVSSGFAKVVMKQGKVQGFMVGIIHENFWGERCAYDIVSYSEWNMPHLLRLFSLWAKENNATPYISNTWGSENYERLIQKCGFKLDTKTFKGEL